MIVETRGDSGTSFVNTVSPFTKWVFWMGRSRDIEGDPTEFELLLLISFSPDGEKND
jgi:hypothetical protein